jgi:ATPase subunit of ABC transporter with duplicated ATPase domains
MLQDPDGFQTTRENEGEAIDAARRFQEEEDERLAMELSYREKQAEQERQRQRHEEEKWREKAKRDAETARKKSEQERAKRNDELKKRAREERLSVEKVKATTKQCPGCQWPIEKNNGCEHMTCTFTFYSIHFGTLCGRNQGISRVKVN